MKKLVIIVSALLLCLSAGAAAPKAITPNDFKGSDTERIQKAVNAAAKTTGSVTIPRENSNGTAIWMIDEAIRVPSGVTILIDNATLQLSDSCRDNMFRSDNVGVGITDPVWNHNIAILGIGNAVIRGAANPRASGDGLRKLALDPAANSVGHRSSYGSDAARPEEKQTSDWRGFLILMAYVDGLRIDGLRVEYAHTWAITCEKVHHARLENLDFYCPQFREVEGRTVHTFNNDGIDLREGCKYFRINNISGVTGDDLIALSALDMGEKYHQNGLLESFQVTSCAHNGPEDDIEHVFITNVKANFQAVAIRASDTASVHHVYINGVQQCKDPLVTTPYRGSVYVLKVGNHAYGSAPEDYKIHDIHAMNIVGDGRCLIQVGNPIRDCTFLNCVYTGLTEDTAITWTKEARERSVNVHVENVIWCPSAADNSVVPELQKF